MAPARGGAGLGLLILLIGISRLTLGVHFVSDVLAGYLMAMAELSLCVALIEWKRDDKVLPLAA